MAGGSHGALARAYYRLKPYLPRNFRWVLRRIRIPALLLNARNDPFVPAGSLPAAHEVGRCVTLWQPAHGGHVGFARGRFPGHGQTLPEAVTGWLQHAMR